MADVGWGGDPELGDRRVLTEYYARTPDGPMWLPEGEPREIGDPPAGRHCQRCGTFADVGARNCPACGKYVTEDPVVGVLVCPKDNERFVWDEWGFRLHYREHLDGAPTPDEVVERARGRAAALPVLRPSLWEADDG